VFRKTGRVTVSLSMLAEEEEVRVNVLCVVMVNEKVRGVPTWAQFTLTTERTGNVGERSVFEVNERLEIGLKRKLLFSSFRKNNFFAVSQKI